MVKGQVVLDLLVFGLSIISKATLEIFHHELPLMG
jgi:hypothetical protein